MFRTIITGILILSPIAAQARTPLTIEETQAVKQAYEQIAAGETTDEVALPKSARAQIRILSGKKGEVLVRISYEMTERQSLALEALPRKELAQSLSRDLAHYAIDNELLFAVQSAARNVKDYVVRFAVAKYGVNLSRGVDKVDGKAVRTLTLKFDTQQPNALSQRSLLSLTRELKHEVPEIGKRILDYLGKNLSKDSVVYLDEVNCTEKLRNNGL